MSVSVLSKTRARPWPLATAAAVCLLSFAAFWVAQRLAHVNMLDVMVYRAEGETVRAGGDLYAMRATSANLGMTYPPFAALLFVPLTLVGVPLMRTLTTAGNLLLVVALVQLSLQLVRPSLSRTDLWRTTLWVAAVVVWCEPVWTTLRYGQINLLIAVAVLWDLTRREGSRWAGLGIGLATAVKLTPGLFVVLLLAAGLLLWRRDRGMNQWLRTALTATGVFLGTTLAVAVALPADSKRFWTETLFETGRVGFAEETANQSIRGVLARLMHTDDPGMWWAVTAAVLGGAAMILAVRAAVRGDKAVAVVVCAFTALMISPISWSHHWVWCVPLLILLADRATRVWPVTGAVALAFASFALWWVPHDPGRPELDQNAGQMLLSAIYPLTATALLVGYALTLRASDRGEGRQAVAKE
ncbi:glycosyltransferase 87 family protein [Streptomyces tanashiensis]|uniref:Glycosyltransferase 87 family protein n=1 Tax=Streptomyces tanashiensis TaxID=67367 RepID=A0ABY6R355_9ACTN|nr:glycosyltransferase 87 family protein [Streptomyces tanashiensis]UZX24022.1 glycosyltransferase 87 family protein [Streptomyces tanashiensis]GGY20503.1 membrane protein [Streptomyces tanashiensis]